jgi:hypothetical protein
MMTISRMKLGKRPPKFDKRTLLLGKYLTKDLPPPPQSVDYTQAVTMWQMYGNDRYGDCTCGAASPFVTAWYSQ